VERLRPVVERLDALEPAAWEPPPALAPLPGAWEALPSPPAATGRPRAPWWRRRLALRPLPAAALAALLLAVGVAAGLLAGGGGEGGGRELVLAPVEPLGGAASGTARIADDGERATLHLTGLRPSRAGDFYELWLLNGPDDIVSLGSFTVPGSGEVDVSVPLPGGTRGFAALDISVEPPDGDPAHSSRSVLRAPLGRL
jgi:anti-sigma-K factor RskA